MRSLLAALSRCPSSKTPAVVALNSLQTKSIPSAPFQKAVAAATDAALSSIEESERRAKSLLEALRDEQEELKREAPNPVRLAMLRKGPPSVLLSHAASSLQFAPSPPATDVALILLGDEESEAAVVAPSNDSSKTSPASALLRPDGGSLALDEGNDGNDAGRSPGLRGDSSAAAVVEFNRLESGGAFRTEESCLSFGRNSHQQSQLVAGTSSPGIEAEASTLTLGGKLCLEVRPSRLGGASKNKAFSKEPQAASPREERRRGCLYCLQHFCPTLLLPPVALAHLRVWKFLGSPG